MKIWLLCFTLTIVLCKLHRRNVFTRDYFSLLLIFFSSWPFSISLFLLTHKVKTLLLSNAGRHWDGACNLPESMWLCAWGRVKSIGCYTLWASPRGGTEKLRLGLQLENLLCPQTIIQPAFASAQLCVAAWCKTKKRSSHFFFPACCICLFTNIN